MAKRPPRVSKRIKSLLEESLQDDLIVGPLLDEFLVKWDGNYSDAAARAISKALRTKERDRSGSWSASSAGFCWRRQELAFLGVQQNGSSDPHLQMIFLNGRWVHLRWQAILMTAAILDNIEVLVKKPKNNSRCSMDGMGIAHRGRYDGAEFGFELKGRNDWQWQKQTNMGVDDKTRKQVDFSFWMSGLDMFVIMNENKNNQLHKEWVFVRDNDRVNEIKQQVKELNKAIEKQKLHPMLDECKKQLSTGEFVSCPFGGRGGACIAAGKWPRKRTK